MGLTAAFVPRITTWCDSSVTEPGLLLASLGACTGRATGDFSSASSSPSSIVGAEGAAGLRQVGAAVTPARDGKPCDGDGDGAVSTLDLAAACSKGRRAPDARLTGVELLYSSNSSRSAELIVDATSLWRPLRSSAVEPLPNTPMEETRRDGVAAATDFRRSSFFLHVVLTSDTNGVSVKKNSESEGGAGVCAGSAGGGPDLDFPRFRVPCTHPRHTHDPCRVNTAHPQPLMRRTRSFAWEINVDARAHGGYGAGRGGAQVVACVLHYPTSVHAGRETASRSVLVPPARANASISSASPIPPSLACI